MAHRRARSTLALGLGLTLIVACQEPQEATSESKPQALEDFASGMSVGGDNVCVGTQPVEVDEASIQVDKSGSYFRGETGAGREREAKAAVRGYLSALPPAVQKSFAALNGRILITDKVEEWCGAASTDESSHHFVAEKRRISGCYLYLNYSEDQRGDVFTIVHSPDVPSIRHGGVRLFGFLYAQFFPRLRSASGTSGGASYELQVREGANLYSLKRELANAFLRDAAKLPAGLNPLGPMLGLGAAARITDKLAGASTTTDVLAGESFVYEGDPDRWPKASDAAKLRVQRFQDFVFAEAFDSYHCNGSTLATMERDFSGTHRAFAPIDAAIAAIARRLVGDDDSSFKLIDGFDLSDFFPMPSQPTASNSTSAAWGWGYDPSASTGGNSSVTSGTGFPDWGSPTGWLDPIMGGSVIGGQIAATYPATGVSPEQSLPIPGGYDVGLGGTVGGLFAGATGSFQTFDAVNPGTGSIVTQ